MELSEERQAEYLEHLRNGTERGAAAYQIGCQTRIEMIDYIAEHPEFARLCDDAQEEAGEHVTEALWQAAVSGSVAAVRLWHQLKRPNAVPTGDAIVNANVDWDADLSELNKLAGD